MDKSDCKYLVRFDDICPTMNWQVWEPIEAGLLRLDIRPLLAVIPDNRDPKLVKEPARADFWERVRHWQALGWTIALHGYQHVYVNRDPGMLRLTPQSEFAGLPREVQEEKLKRGLAIFAAQGVRADAWIGPSHSFDRTTVELLSELGIPVISDGLWAWPHREANGIVWVPQQLWRFHPKPAGIWTVCHHHNSWTAGYLDEFESDLAAYATKITDLPSVLRAFAGRKLTILDRWTALRTLIWNHRIRNGLSYLRRQVLRRRKRSA